MRKTLPALLFCALALTVLAACGPLATPTTTAAEATALVAGLTLMPGGTPVVVTTLPNGSLTPGAATPLPGQTLAVPVTGSMADTRVLCKLCVEGLDHALLLLPAGATYQLVLPPNGKPITTTCGAVEQVNGRQVLLCYAPPRTTFAINICINNQCSQFPVKLDTCPAANQPQAPANVAATATGILPSPTLQLPTTTSPAPTATVPAPTDTPRAPTDTPPVVPTDTPAP